MNQVKHKTPKSWDELKLILDYLSFCSPDFLRLPDDKRFYNLFRDLVPREIALEIIKRQIGNQDSVILKNNFPYTKVLRNLKNVTHYCLWNKKGRLKKSQIKQMVKEKFGNSEWCLSERKLNKKSVPEIWHCHIFVSENK